MKKRAIILIPFIILAIIIISFLIFRNIQLGYGKISIIYDKTNGSQTIELGIPKLSFMAKENDKSYSFKNIRSNKNLTKEVKDFLKTLELIKCNDTTYYYDKKNNFTIIDYSIKTHFIYNTISYKVSDGNYCEDMNIIEEKNRYEEIFGEVRTFGFYSNENDNKLSIAFYIYFPNTRTNEFRGELAIGSNGSWLEASEGYFIIENNELIYTRTTINKKNDTIVIPEKSVFKIQNKKLILIDNYLSDYERNIILE